MADGPRSQVAGAQASAGLIWEAGYQAGELRGEVYPDVPPAMRRWRAARHRDRHLLVGQRAGAAPAVRVHRARRSDAAHCRRSSTRRVGAKASRGQLRADRRGARPRRRRDPVRLRRHARTRGRARPPASGRVLSLRPGNPPQPDAGEFEAVRSLRRDPAGRSARSARSMRALAT